MNYRDIIMELCAITAPSGFEKPIREKLMTLAGSVEAVVDARGNLILHKPGSGKRILLAAQMDSTGFILTYRDDKGFYRMGSLGYNSGFASLAGLPVRFANGAKGVIGCDGNAGDKIELKHLYIDVVSGSVRIGDACAVDLPVYADGDTIAAAGIERSTACAILMDVFLRSRTSADLYAAFCVQSQIGERGGSAAAFRVNPDIAVSIDAVPSGDVPNAAACKEVKVGGGPVLPVLIGAGAANMDLLERVEKGSEISLQRTVADTAHSELFNLQSSQSGVQAISAAVPVRQYGQMGLVNLKDAEACAELVLKAIV